MKTNSIIITILGAIIGMAMVVAIVSLVHARRDSKAAGNPHETDYTNEMVFSDSFYPHQTGTNNIAIGYHAGMNLRTNSNVVLLGRGAEASSDNELVIRFVGGSEFRMKLPLPVDMSGMYPSWPTN